MLLHRKTNHLSTTSKIHYCLIIIIGHIQATLVNNTNGLYYIPIQFILSNIRTDTVRAVRQLIGWYSLKYHCSLWILRSIHSTSNYIQLLVLRSIIISLEVLKSINYTTDYACLWKLLDVMLYHIPLVLVLNNYTMKYREVTYNVSPESTMWAQITPS